MLRVRSILLLAALLAACLAAPAAAAEQVDSLPALREFTSGRFEYATTVNGQVLAYGNGQIESPARITYVYVVLAPGSQPTTTYYLIYDGERYMRAEGQSEWTKLTAGATPIPRPSTDALVNLADRGTITRIGDADVAGTATEQYQIWVPGGTISGGGTLKVDVFVGKATPYIYKLQVTASSPSSEIGLIYRFYDQNAPGIVVPAPTPAPASGQAGEAEFTGGVWKWQQTQYGDDTIAKPDDPSKYTLEFLPENRVSVLADCNRGNGGYTRDGSQLTIGPLALTRALCPEGSQSDRYIRDLGAVRSFVIRDGKLYLSLMADAGIMEFARGG